MWSLNEPSPWLMTAPSSKFVSPHGTSRPVVKSSSMPLAQTIDCSGNVSNETIMQLGLWESFRIRPIVKVGSANGSADRILKSQPDVRVLFTRDWMADHWALAHTSLICWCVVYARAKRTANCAWCHRIEKIPIFGPGSIFYARKSNPMK